MDVRRKKKRTHTHTHECILLRKIMHVGIKASVKLLDQTVEDENFKVF